MKLKKYFFFLLCIPAFTNAQIAVKADTIYTMAGNKLVNGVVLIKGNKIDAVGQNISIPAGYTTYNAKVVTPGFVDVRSTVGLAGAFNQPFDANQLDKSNAIQPELRAIDAYDPEDKLVAWLRQNGVTTVHTGHGWGALMSGQTMIAKTKVGVTDDVVIDPETMVAMTIGGSVRGNYTSPGTASKGIALLRSELLKAQSQIRTPKKDSSKSDIKQEILQKLLKREIRALIYAQTAVDIQNALRLAKEFNLKMVLEGVAEGYRIPGQIKASGAEIIVHPTMFRAGGETANMSFENAAMLHRAGIPVTIESGYEAYVPKVRLVNMEAAMAMTYGLPYEEALKAVTINAAKLLGIDKRVGSIEKGKDADLVLFNGDPFEYTSKPCVVIIDGKVEAENCK